MTEPPGPFDQVRIGAATAWARPEARPWVEASLDAGLTLHQAGAGAAGGGEALSGGRGPAYVIRCGAGAWVVRHGFRGGAVAALLGDRYLRVGTPRPFHEARMSVEARRRGVPTPRVVAAAIYPSGIFYRGDVVTDLVPGARSVGDLLFGPERNQDPAFREQLIRAAAAMPLRLARWGVQHRDLNVDNLLRPGDNPGGEGGWPPGELVVLDLDRCRLRRGALEDGGRAMAARLERSLRRGEERRGPALNDREWGALRGVSSSPPGEAPPGRPGGGGTGTR